MNRLTRTIHQDRPTLKTKTKSNGIFPNTDSDLVLKPRQVTYRLLMIYRFEFRIAIFATFVRCRYASSRLLEVVLFVAFSAFWSQPMPLCPPLISAVSMSQVSIATYIRRQALLYCPT